jgi:predicted nucleic acid-binding Zn ribbon protein
MQEVRSSLRKNPEVLRQDGQEVPWGVVEQMISAPAVQFKGSGWYVTDYAKKSTSPGSSGGDSGSKDKTEDKSKADSSAKAESSSKETSKESASKAGSSKESSPKETPRKGSGRHK